MGISGGPDMIQDGLVLTLDALDRNSYVSGSTTWVDVSGNTNSGSLINGPTFDSGSISSIVFDGVNDYAESKVINLANNGTVSVWIYKTGNGLPDGGGVVDFFSNVNIGGTAGWAVGMNVNTSKVDFYIANNGGFGVENFSTASIANNTWYNVVCTYNGASKIIYINGTQDATYASSVNGTNSTDKWGVASRVQGPSGLRCFKGNIPNVQVYNRALTASEVLQNYNALKSRFNL
jgi:hypothetical protein